MKAHEGDVLRFVGRTVGATEHHATVVQVLGENGEPPYRVCYEDGHETRCSRPGMRDEQEPSGTRDLVRAGASGEAVTRYAAGGGNSSARQPVSAAPGCHGAGQCEARPPQGRAAARAAGTSLGGRCCPSSAGGASTRSGCAVCSADTAARPAVAGVLGLGGLCRGHGDGHCAVAEGLSATSRPRFLCSPVTRSSRSLISMSMPSRLRPDGWTSTTWVSSVFCACPLPATGRMRRQRWQIPQPLSRAARVRRTRRPPVQPAVHLGESAAKAQPAAPVTR